MDIQKIEKQIQQRREKLQILEKELEEKRKVHDYHRQQFAKLTAMHAGKRKLPQSVHTTKRAVAEWQLEVDAAEGAIELISKEVESLQEQKEAVSFFQTYSVRYTDAQKSCQEALDRIEQSNLKQEVESIIQSVRTIVHGSQEIAQSYNRLSTGLQSQYSLNAALDGDLRELGEDETEDRNDTAKTVGEVIQSFALFDEILSPSDLEYLGSVLEMAQRWKHMIGARDPIDIVQGRQSLVVEEKKRTEQARYVSPKETETRRPPVKNLNRVVFDPRKPNDFIGSQ